MASEKRAKGTLDGGWSWFVVLGSFLSQFVVMGVNNVFGLLYIDLLKEFGKGKAITAWVGSSAFGIVFIIGPFTTALCTKLGCRIAAVAGGLLFALGLLCTSLVKSLYLMFLTYSVFFAVGGSLCYYSSVLVLSEYFSKNLVLANGLGLSGAGVGTIALAPFVNFLQFHFNWRTTLKILSALSAVLVFSGVLYQLIPTPTSHPVMKKEASVKQIDFSVLKNKAYLVWVAVVGLVLFGFYIPYVHLVRHCQDLNIPQGKSAVLVGYIAISQTLGKVFFGRVSDHPRVNRVYLHQLCLLICSVLTTLLPILTSYSSIVVYCWLYGFHDGCFVVLIAVLTGDIAGRKKLAPAFGMMYFVTGIPMMIGPPVAGWMYEIKQTYNPAFFMAGAFTTLGVCLLFLVPFLLPPEVEQEWISRSKGSRVRLDPPPSGESSGHRTKSYNSESDLEMNESKDSQNHPMLPLRESDQRAAGSTISLSYILDKYLSMPKLTSHEDAVLGRIYSSNENFWIPLFASSKETDV